MWVPFYLAEPHNWLALTSDDSNAFLLYHISRVTYMCNSYGLQGLKLSSIFMLYPAAKNMGLRSSSLSFYHYFKYSLFLIH